MSEQITDWENITGSRFYLVTKGPGNLILGIFSNRQKLMQALTFSGLDECYIRGTRKNKEVNDFFFFLPKSKMLIPVFLRLLFSSRSCSNCGSSACNNFYTFGISSAVRSSP